MVEEIPADATSKYYIFGKKVSGRIDFLRTLVIENGISDISDIDASSYPLIILKGRLQSLQQIFLPQLRRISVDFIGTPELAANYQVVSVSDDTVLIGKILD